LSTRQLLEDLRHALHAFLDLEDEAWCEAWNRTLVFGMTEPETAIFADLPCADDPPTVYLLATRVDDDREVHELLWCPDPETPEESWPVVEVDPDGETHVAAASGADWIDALLFTGGVLSGGTEEDLEAAAEDATHEARELANDLADELDRDLTDLEGLAERWEEAVEQWSDLWAERVEAVD